MTKLAEVLRLDNLFPHPERLGAVPGESRHEPLHERSGCLSGQACTLHSPLLTTMRGMPQIYSGDEIAMHGGDDPDDRRDFPGGFKPVPRTTRLRPLAGRRRRRLAFQFSPGAAEDCAAGDRLRLQTGSSEQVRVREQGRAWCMCGFAGSGPREHAERSCDRR